MSLDFTAIDFETANSHRGSPCSVGLVKVRAGRLIEEAHWLIRPPEPFDYFDRFNTWLHGISEASVQSSPGWGQTLPRLLDFVGGDVLTPLEGSWAAAGPAGFEWVTSHTFRKTVATVLDDAGLSARQIADQLGHARPSLTQDVYMGRKVATKAAAEML